MKVKIWGNINKRWRENEAECSVFNRKNEINGVRFSDGSFLNTLEFGGQLEIVKSTGYEDIQGETIFDGDLLQFSEDTRILEVKWNKDLGYWEVTFKGEHIGFLANIIKDPKGLKIIKNKREK